MTCSSRTAPLSARRTCRTCCDGWLSHGPGWRRRSMPGARDDPPAPEGGTGPGRTPSVGDLAWYSYAVLRVVPRVDRGECVNVGVVLFARTRGFLAAAIALDAVRLRALAPTLALDAV